MKLLSFFLFCFLSFNARAWYCYEVASERNGSVINACGIGEASDEDSARKVALNNAYKELDLICSHSVDCADKALEITPLRTDCKKVDSSFRCHRGITAQITPKPRDITQTHLLQEVFIPKKIIQQDGTNAFQNTSIVDFNSTPQGARVHVDGVEICQTPCTKEIDQGEHKLTYEKEDYEFYTEVKQIGKGRQSLGANLQMRYGYVTIIGLPVDAVIKVNNKEISARDSIRLSPNDHVLSVTSKYFQPWFKQFQIKKGEILQFKYDADALLGHMKISAVDEHGNPMEASIMINGKQLAEKTPTAIPVNSGNNLITLSAPRYKNNTFSITLEANQKMEIKKEMTPNHFKSWEWYFGFGLSGESVKNLKKDDQYGCCFLLDLGVAKTVSDHFSLRINYNYIGKIANNDYSTKSYQGTANTTAYYAHDFSGHLVSVALPFYADRDSPFYFGPEYGLFSSQYKMDKYVYSNWGTGSKIDGDKNYSFAQKFIGIFAGGEWLHTNESKGTSSGYYFLLGTRLFNPPSNTQSDFVSNLTSTPIKKLSFYGTFGFVGAW